MKKMILVVFIAILGNVAMAKGGEKEAKFKTSAICEMCKERIEKNLALSKGVKDAVLNLDDKVVTIKYNTKKTSEAKLKKIIIETGYDADEQIADDKAHEKLPSCCKKSSTMHQ